MKKESGWIKFLRVVIYVFSISGTAIGASLIKTGDLSSAYADGTHIAKVQNGEIIFFASLIMLCANIIWGVLRWFLRGYREKWRAGRIIGKLIGGGIWRTLIIIPLVLVSILLLAPVFNNIIENNVVAEQSNFEPYDPDYAEHRLEYLEEHLEELDPEKVYEEITELALLNIRFGSDDEARENNITTSSSGIFTNNAYARTTSVIFLNKAKLSTNGKFVIFYTSYGDDKISDTDAEELGDMLESIIVGYKENLGFEYSYQQYDAPLNIVNTEIKATLALNGLDTNILATAMPVYVADPYRDKESTILASYASTDYLERLVQIGIVIQDLAPGLFEHKVGKDNADQVDFYSTAPSFPFINIKPQNISTSRLKAVVAHELGHHYAHLYTDANNLESGGENFVKETIPNWMAANALSNEPLDGFINRSYNKTYLDHGTDIAPYQLPPGCEERSGCDGYPLTAFLQNYYEVVKDGKTKIMNSLPYDDEEALKYLYDEAGAEQFTKAMVSLAEKNLTGDYGGKLINITMPKGETLGCADYCMNSYTINPAATNYLYFSTSEYENATIRFIGNDTVRASILGQSVDGKFEIISSNNIEKEYKITTEGRFAEFQMIAFAVANASTSTGTYEIEIESEGLEDLIDKNSTNKYTIPDRNIDFSDLYKVTEPGCYEINTDKLFDNLIELIGLGSDFIDAFSHIDTTNDYSGLKSSYEQSSAEASSNITEAKNALSGYRITICFNNLKKGIGMENAKKRAFFRYKINFLNTELDSTKISGFISADLLTRTGKIYILTENDDDTMLVTVNVTER